MSFESACPCLGPPARLVRISSGGSFGRCNAPALSCRVIPTTYYVKRSNARSSSQESETLSRRASATASPTLCIVVRMGPDEIADLVQLRRARDHVDRHYADPLDVSSM